MPRGPSRHQSFRVCKVNRATPKVATNKPCLSSCFRFFESRCHGGSHPRSAQPEAYCGWQACSAEAHRGPLGDAAHGVFPRSPQASWWSADDARSGAVSSPERAWSGSTRVEDGRGRARTRVVCGRGVVRDASRRGGQVWMRSWRRVVTLQAATRTCSKRPGRSCFLSRCRRERWCVSSVSRSGGS